MSEPDWSKVLKHLYENDGALTIQDDMGIPEGQEGKREREKMEQLQRKLIEECDISAEGVGEVNDTLTHMNNTDLIERTKNPDFSRIKLTPKGFDVAHERELSNRNSRINYSIALFTSILVLTEIVGVMPVEDWVKFASGFVILVGLVAIIWWYPSLNISR